MNKLMMMIGAAAAVGVMLPRQSSSSVSSFSFVPFGLKSWSFELELESGMINHADHAGTCR